MKTLFLLLGTIFFSFSTYSQSVKNDTVRLLGVYTIPFNAPFQNTVIGGLSGIDIAPDGSFYFIADDRSEFNPARFYKAKMEYGSKGIDTIVWEEMHYILREDGSTFPESSIDPEAIRLSSTKNTLYYCSEGDRKRGVKPFLYEMTLDGKFIRKMALPHNFIFEENIGMIHNGALESISLSTNPDHLWIINEEPLLEDGPRADVYPTKSPLRLSLLNHKTGKLLYQFVYTLGTIAAPPIKEFDFKVNTVPEILALSDDEFLILERAYVQDIGNFINLFVCEIGEATDVKNIHSLVEYDYKPISRRLWIDFSKYGIKPDNIEGITWGKTLPNGNRTLIFVSDNNFNDSQINQFWLFEVVKK